MILKALLLSFLFVELHFKREERIRMNINEWHLWIRTIVKFYRGISTGRRHRFTIFPLVSLFWRAQMCSAKERLLFVSQTLYAIPLLEEDRWKNEEEKNTTKQVLQNILRSRLPVSASSTIVCKLKIYILLKTEQCSPTTMPSNQSINMMFTFK